MIVGKRESFGIVMDGVGDLIDDKGKGKGKGRRKKKMRMEGS